MAEQPVEDIMIEDDQYSDDPIPLQEETDKADSVRREEALTAVAVNRGYNPTGTPDLLEEYKKTFELTYDSSANDLVGGAKQQALQESVELAVEINPQSPEVATGFLEQRQAELNDKAAASQMMVEALSKIDDELSQAQAANHYIQGRMHKLLSESKGASKFWDVAGELLAINSFIDRDDMIEMFGVDEIESTKDIASRLATMDPVERAELYPALEAAVLEATDGNKVRAAKFLSELYGFEPDAGAADAFWSAVDVAAFTPYGWIKNLMFAARRGSTAKTIAKVNPDAGANIIAGAAKSDEVAEATGVSKANAAESASPFNYEGVSVGAVDGIEDSIVVAVKEQNEAVAAALRTEEELLGKQAVFSDAEMAAARAEFRAKIKNGEFEKETGWSATNAAVIKKNDQEFVVKFEGVNADGVKIKGDFEVPYTRKDVNSFEPDVEFSAFTSNIASPSVWANKFQEGIVEKATALGFKEEASLIRYLNIGKELTKPLNKESIARVDQILLKGDSYVVDGDNVGKVFSIKELMYEGVDGIKLTVDEVKAYFGIRQMWDHVHKLMEQATKAEWKFDGVKLVGQFGKDAQYGKVISGADMPRDATHVMDLRTRSPVSIESLAKDLREAKVEIVKLRKNIEVEDSIYEFAAIKKGSSRNLPDSGILPYRVGYVPRVRDNANYVVHAPADKKINGANGKIIQAKGLFSSRKEAEAFAAKQEEKTGIKHTASVDREVDVDLRSDLASIQMGRPYTGQRVTDRNIILGNGVERITALDALERNLSAMTTMVNMNAFRMGQLERFRKTAAPYLIDPKDVNSGFKRGLDDRKVNALDSMKTWLDDQFRIPTRHEQQWEGTVRHMAEWMEGNKFFLNGKGNAFRLWLQREGTQDVTARLRGATFHALLGWFNPAQLMIQASGAALAFSLNPAKFPKVMMQYKMLRANIFQGDDVARATAKKLGVDEDEWVATVNAVKKSGIMESVKTNADYQAARLGYGITSNAVRQAADSGLMFFREGEMFNRGYAWLLAADQYKDLQNMKSLAQLTDNDINNITQRMAQYTLNLNRSNRAAWQKGWTSIPTQFWQVTTKFTETMLGANRALSKSERARVALGQFALFGATGLPAGNWLLNSFYEWSGQDAGELSPEEVAAARQGLVGVTFQTMVGEEIDISSRVAMFSGYDMMLDTVTADKPITDTLLGALGALPERTYQAVAASGPVLRTTDFSKEDLFSVAKEFGNIISTMRNADKAYMMAQLGYMPLSDGSRLDTVDWSDDWKMLVAQAAGFSPMKVRDYYQIKKTEKSMQQYRGDKVKIIMKAWEKHIASGKGLTKDGQDRWNKLQALIMADLDPADQIKVMESVSEKLTSDKLLYHEVYNRGLEQVLRTGVSGTKFTRMPFSAQNYEVNE